MESKVWLKEEVAHCHGALRSAVCNNHAGTTKLLLDAGVEIRDHHYLLGHAVRHGSTHVLTLLLKNGANVNARDHKGETVLMQAVDKDTIQMASLLLDAKADVLRM